MKRVVQVDAQGREELMKLVDQLNAELRDAEEDRVERTGSRPDTSWRVIALPASEAEVAAAKAAKEREQGRPPL